MTVAQEMLRTHPKDSGDAERAQLAACIEVSIVCAQACTACADACLSEDSVADLAKCIGTNLDCADLCAVNAKILTRRTGYDANLTRAVVRACALACKSCADECGSHAEHHEHCKICADACRRCEQTCNDLLASLS